MKNPISKMLVYGIVGIVLYGIGNILLKNDPALHIAQQLGLGNGILLAGLLGGLVGLYLSLGGQKRIINFGGLLIGVALGVGFYYWAKPHAWIIQAILVGAFGQNGTLYAPLASVMLLLGVIRLGANLGERGLKWLLAWAETRQDYKRMVQEAVQAELAK